jgi:very-short-patch-repair endonuclease
MGPNSRTVDQKIAELGTSEHGIVSRRELLAAGVSDKQIRVRLRRGSLHPEYEGVYRVGHRAPSVEARYLAAVKACGDDAVLSGKAAAFLWGILKGKPPPPEVTAPTERRVRGLAPRRRKLRRDDVTARRGIPVTTVAATIVDLAPDLDREQLARVCHEAGALHHTTPRQVEAVLATRYRPPGAPKLREVIHGDVHVLLSKVERRFIQLLRADQLPLPITNRVASGRRVDCRWPEHKLTVELDSYTYHSSRHAWEQDRRREREAYARGDQFRRYTRDDVLEHPQLMLGELRSLLPAVSSPTR